MAAMAPGVEQAIIEGIYKLSTRAVGSGGTKVQLFGSAAILREALRAQEILADRYNVSSNVWSVTSYKELRRNALAAERWNLLHPAEKPQRSYLEEVLDGEQGPFIAASDYVRAMPESIDRWIPGGLFALGTDGFGRSETREALRRHFEVDAESIVVAALYRLSREGKCEASKVAQAIKDLGIDPEKIDPAGA